MYSFFVSGSVPPNVGEMAPVYMINDHAHTYDLPDTYKHDHDILQEETGHTAFHYGPPLWRLGYTDFYNDLEENKTNMDAVNAIIARCEKVIIPKGEKIYRVRINPRENLFDGSTYDSPPDKSEFGRFDSANLNIFYGSFDVEACIHECKATLIDEIVLATFTANCDLHLINFYDNFKELESGPFRSIQLTFHGLLSTTTEYDHCRRLALQAHTLNYDGFLFKSFYSIAKNDPIKNVGIFGRPVLESKLFLDSVNRIRLTRLDIDFILGPL
jgi:hypothetical protein